MRAGSLRTRITGAALAALLVGGALAVGLLVAAVERDGRQAVDEDLLQRADSLAGQGPQPAPPGGPGGPDEDQALLAGSDTFVQVAQGDQLVELRGDVPADAPAVPQREGFSTVDIDGRPWRSLTVSSLAQDGARYQVLTSLEPVEDRAGRIRRLAILIGLGALTVTALGAWLLTSLAVRPLDRLRAGAARVSGAEDLSTPLPEDEGSDEVRSLARALNEMLARLRASSEAMQRALAATRRFAADAGHEMRTPLTGLRATIDMLERNPDLPEDERRRLVRAVAEEQERIVHLLEGLQALARGDAAESLPRERVELADLVDGALYGARRRHPGVEFELELDEDVGDASVEGWPDGVRLVVDNLLDNAALHGSPNGTVRVSLRGDDGSLLVRVEDDGPGIPDGEERDRLLEPFTRGRVTKAPGSGLGLAIVAQQVALHGGELRLDGSPLGGLGVEVRLPSG